MSSNFGRAASAGENNTGRGSRFNRTASARETGSPGAVSSDSSTDGGVSLGSLGASMSRLSFAEAVGVRDAPRGMNDHDDPFGIRQEPRTHVVEHRNRETRRGRNSNGTVDAQAFYPASACVFVAKYVLSLTQHLLVSFTDGVISLPEAMDNIQLERELNDAFGEYGAVFIKIRRDKDNMPYAFCQYTNDQDASNAMARGAGKEFLGRPCRIEMVRANRTFILRNYVGGDVSINEARQILEQFGPIGRVEEITAETAYANGIRQGVMVEFKNYDPDRDVQAAFRHHAFYRVTAYDVHRARRTHPTTNADQAYQRRYELDSRSIFIGNLPEDVASLEREVRNLAGEIGHVLSVQVIRKEGRHGYGVSAFAFVEFQTASIAEQAAQELTGRRICGSRIRVERKETREPGNGPARRPAREANLFTPRHADYTPRRMANTPRRVDSDVDRTGGVPVNGPPTAPVLAPATMALPTASFPLGILTPRTTPRRLSWHPLV
ncbi:uncharacterized protein PG998_012601 [Apiospora kogelbergensis]|uniref:uncharacterized protein n=1 Tax=Apiospora kogelbergensis TaxID=1337665 RepID=UPI00313080EE